MFYTPDLALTIKCTLSASMVRSVHARHTNGMPTKNYHLIIR